ncbi:MAG: capsule assembly Wzi family protein [Candidatus Eisenbacteria bacterium]
MAARRVVPSVVPPSVVHPGHDGRRAGARLALFLTVLLVVLSLPVPASALEEPFLRWDFVDQRFRSDLRERPVEREWESPEASQVQLAVVAVDPWGDRTVDYPVHFLPEEDGLASEGPGVAALEARTALPLPRGFGFAGGVQATNTASTVDQAEVTEAEFSWRGDRHRWGVGRSKLRWGAGTSGSLLAGRSAPPRWQLRWRTERALQVPTFGWGPLRGRTWTGSTFLAYLDDDHRQIPDPLLFGHRLGFQPWAWCELNVTRTILFGGEGRTGRLDLPAVLDILLGHNENRVGDRPPGDSDQMASYELRLRMPPAWLPEGLEGVDLYWEYAGEDMIHFPIPSAVAHQIGALARIRGWTFGVDLVETVTGGVNRWYDHYLVYGPMDHTYSGFPLGHSIGGDAELLEVSAWSPPGDLRGRIQFRIEEYGFFRETTRTFHVAELSGRARAHRRLVVELSVLRGWRAAEGSTERAPDREKSRVDFRLTWVP